MSTRSAARDFRRARRKASSGVERRGALSSASARWRRVARRPGAAAEGPRGAMGARELTGSGLHGPRSVSAVQQSSRTLHSARLNILDELYLHLDRADEPFSV